MEMFLSSKFIFSKKFYIIFFILFILFCGVCTDCISAENYAKCHSIIEINGLASNDYINSKTQTFSIGYQTTSTTDTVSSLNNTYKNFIQTPTDYNSENNNFLFLIVKGKDIKNDLSCGFNSGDIILCNSSQLWGSGCKENYDEEVIVNGVTTTKTTPITTCELFNQQNTKIADSACYPQNHICNTYKNDVTNKYFSINGAKMPSAVNGKFYIYTKNVVVESKGSKEKTCDFEILPCDLKIKNEITTNGFVNVVFKDTSNKYNKKFIENISSGYNETDMFFRYVGKTIKSDSNYNTIMKAPYYYKYVTKDSEGGITNDTIIFYYKKYLTGGTDPKGRICSGYLPNCKYVDPNEESNSALYNRVSNGNKNNRNSFYNGKVSGISNVVKEEYLWFAANPYSSGQVCLSRTGTANNVNHDIGYCSDLIDDFSDLKYKKGLEYNEDGTPKCYLKSCIDLTVEELEKIKNENSSGNYKWCSEYYYLESSGGLKYFPKEKPEYCSDLDSDGYLKYRATWEDDGGKYKYCAETGNTGECSTYGYYSYGGGRNSTKSNCYLKNCFSLNDKERQEVADANATNVGFEIEKYANDLSKFSRDNLPRYCDNGFLFNNKMDEFKDFDYLNLNVISCLDFSDEQLNAIDAERMILFTDLLDKYDTESSKVFCRTHYKPLNKSELVDVAKIHNEKTNFLETMYIIADESKNISSQSPYKSLLNTKYGTDGYNVGLNSGPFVNVPERAKSDYKKISIGDVKKAGVNKHLFSNICSYVDNSFLYYNADIWDLRYDIINAGSNGKISEVIDSIQSGDVSVKEYLTCKNDDCSSNEDGTFTCQSKAYIINNEEAIKQNGEVVPDDCKKCNKYAEPLKKYKCLYEVTKKDCKPYAYDYKCKRDKGCFGKDGITIANKVCFLKENISDYIIDCDQYISKKSVTNFFDCSLFSNSDYEDIYKNYLNYGDKGLVEKDLEEIRKKCSDTIPLTDTRSLPEPDSNSALLKPFKINTASFNSGALGTTSKIDFERYGCAVYNRPTNVTDVLSAQLWGCKVPDIDSSYISKYNSNFVINNVSFKEEFKKPYLSQMAISVCSRYPEDKYTDNKCGQREGSSYKDKCLEIIVDNENVSNSVTLEDTTKGIWYFEDSTGGSRFRYEKHGRDILVFRDFYTYYKCNASNIDSKYYYYDEKSAGLITVEAIGLGTVIGALTGAIACAFLFLIPGGGVALYAFCVAEAIYAAILISIASMLLSRTEEYNLSLQNNLYYPHEYFGNNEDYGKYGFLSKANITNNDNYIYRYYRRANTIQEDLKNKLESNIDWDENNTRFFFGNTLSKDIIRKCNIQNLFGLTGNCVGAKYEGNISDDEEQISYNQTIHCDYEYSFFELEDDGTRKQENGSDKKCDVGSNESAEKCLTNTQKECLAGYGVKFLFNSNINNSFIMSEGGFLNTYQDGDSVKQNWGTEAADNYNWVPVNMVPYTMDVSSKSDLKKEPTEGSLKNCRLMKYGDSFGSLSRCRGFEHDGVFYTESQSIKTPLFTSPVFFYTLITPKNIPELFNPTIVLEYYYLFSKYENGVIADSNRNEFDASMSEVVLDFYNPKVQYYYDFANGTVDDSYNNKYTENNKFISEIKSNEKIGVAHVLRYISDVFVNEMSYGFTIDKSFTKTLHNSYTPQVCLYQIKAINSNESGLNTKVNTSYCDKDKCKYERYVSGGRGDIVSCCLEKGANQDFIVLDNNVECYERAIPFLSDFVFMQSKNIEYNNPVINVYLKPSYKTMNDVISDKSTYILKDGDSEDILLNGENYTQSFGLNFERSYCSKAYYDYYKNLDLLKKELNSENMDLSKVSLYKKNISTIESIVIPDCKKDDGNEIDLLINEDKMRTYNDVNGVFNNIVVKETVKVKEDNALYGGFNEICVAENDVKHILKTYNRQRKTSVKLPSVLVYKSKKDIEQRKTKCILDINSMKNSQCLITNKAYIYCTEEEINFEGDKCKKKLDITNNKEIYVREVDCSSILKSIKTDSSLEFIKDYINNGGSVEDIQACYKGGFNMMNTVYKNESTQEYSCSCVTVSNSSDYDKYKEFVNMREITLREYGLCIDLVKPSICPAVRYFDSQSQYVDDRLALGKTEEELKTMDKGTYEQHSWRTAEKQLGILPSVFYESSLGHAEFPASVYCGGNKTRYKKRCDCETEKKYKKINDNSYAEDENGEYIKVGDNDYRKCTDYCNGYEEYKYGEYVEDVAGNKIKAEEYYKNTCVGGSVAIEGECNGYWKENIKSVPVAICTERVNEESGTRIYEYELLNYGCERYVCPAIGYDANTNVKNLDEKTIEYNDSQLFTENEMKTFSSGVELTDFSSFKHNEELSASSADVRGASNGFAVWGDEQNTDGSRNVVSDDYAKIITSTSCLTGFAPAGTNYKLLTDFSNSIITNYEDYNIYYQNTSSNINNKNTYESFKTTESYKNSLLQMYKDRQMYYNNIIDKSTRMPQRRCNQFGEWMTVEDPYNNALISTVYGENYYYNSSSNFWKKIYKMPMDDSLTDEEIIENGLTTEIITAIKNTNYCERLVCPEISSKGNNYFKTEFLYDINKAKNSDDIKNSKKEYYNFWKHSGGAFWDMIGTPRNSTNTIAKDGDSIVYGDSSRSIKNIFSATVANDSIVNNKYKYIKKVYGRCENEFGYYNRGSEFNNNSFNSQYNKLIETLFSSVGENGEVNPREESMLNSSAEIIKPTRHCTSIGLWSGVLDPCFRACEMMDIYHTTFKDNLYNVKDGGKQANIIGGNEYFVENSDIISIDLAVNNLQLDGKRGEFEQRFNTLHKEEDLDRYSSTTSSSLTRPATGDYLTGGAKWPRSIVNINNSNVKLETSGSKAGLRYIEVETECDSSYDTGDNRVRQFVARAINKKPKRRCYEDGSWGPVYGDTRCILYKNCQDFSLTLFNLTNLMKMYNENKTAVDINNYIANIQYGTAIHLINSGSNTGNMTTKIYEFSAVNTSFGESESYNIIKTLDESKYLTTIDNGSDLSSCGTEISSKCINSSICNTTTSGGDNSVTKSGWSLNLKGSDGNIDTNIGRYFKPTTCTLNNSNDSFYVGSFNERGLDNINDLNRIKLVYAPSGNYRNKLHYSKESLLNYSYNLLNGGIPSNCDNRHLGNSNYDKTTIQNESCKGINIGKDYYNSYQVHYECKDEYYNKLSVNGGDNYYNKHIIFECETKNDTKGKFYYNSNTENNEGGEKEIIRAVDCEPITCGDNDKYQKNWSGSIIKELKGNTAGIFVNSKSALKCPENTAFIFKSKPVINEDDGGSVKYYEANAVSYSNYFFVSEIYGTCSRSKASKGEINGTIVDENSYDYRRFGEIKLGNLLSGNKLCTDIYKKNCHSVTESEIFANSDEFLKKYCVPMACPYKNLKFVDGGQSGNDTVEENGSFSLPGSAVDRYEFGTNVVIQSMDGDYKNGRTKEYCEEYYEIHKDKDNDGCERDMGSKGYSDGTVVDHWRFYGALVNDSCVYAVKKVKEKCEISDNSQRDTTITLDKSNIFYNYAVNGSDVNKKITGNICNSNEDIYTEGGPTKYTLYDFLNTITNSEEKIKVDSCFNMIINNDIVVYNNGCQTGYTPIGTDKVCVKYDNNSSIQSNIKSLQNLSNSISEFEITDTHKQNVAEFIVDTIMFNGININKSGEYISNTYTKIFKEENSKWVETDTNINVTLTSEANKLINKAKTNTLEYMKDNIKFLYETCKYDEESWYASVNPDNLTAVIYNSSANSNNNILMQKYKEIIGIDNGFYEYTQNGETKVGILTNDDVDGCKQNVTKYTMSSLVGGYYKIKKEEPKCALEEKLNNNQIMIGSDVYTKMSTSEACYILVEKNKFSYTFDSILFGESETYTDTNGIIWTKQSDASLCNTVSETQVCATAEICPNTELDTTSYKLVGVGNETCMIDGIKVDKLNPIGKCFYQTNASESLATVTDLVGGKYIDCGTITNCTDIVSKQLNNESGNNVLISTAISGDVEYLGGTWVNSDKETCDDGYYFTTKEVTISGKGFVSLDIYIKKYEEKYAQEMNRLKNELKTNIKTKSAGSDNNAKEAYNNLFDKWVEKYRTEEFMDNVYTNEVTNEIIDNDGLYNIYQQVKDEQTTGIGSRVINNDFYKICIGSSEENMNCKDIDYLNNDEICVDYNNNSICLTKINETNNVCIVSGSSKECKKVDFNTDTPINYENSSLYIWFASINDSFEYLEDVKTNADDLITILQKDISDCGTYYINYYNKKISHDAEQDEIKTKFHNGLFMAMECTPEGWKPLTNSSCKKRCGRGEFEGDFKPKHSIDIFRNVKMFVSGMRHSVELDSTVVVHQDSTSSQEHWAAGQYNLKCINGEYFDFSGETKNYVKADLNIDNHNYRHFKIGYDGTNEITAARVYTSCENTYVSAYPQWNQLRGSNDLTTSNLDKHIINGKSCKTGSNAMEGWSSTSATVGCYYCRGGFTQIGFTSYNHVDDAEYWDNDMQGVDYHRYQHKK